MNILRGILAIWGALSIAGFSQGAGGDAPAAIQPDAVPQVEGSVVLDLADDGVRVAVLGYHDFSEAERETAMRIRTSKFRVQMQALKDLGIEVIPMEDFTAWKNGEKEIPEKSVVITLDDGWKSVYTDAYPVLKEFGYPFTIYLYKAYVDGGGKALTTPMIREMMENGATIGSHSATHPFPQTVKEARKRGEKDFDKFLDVEMGDSKRFLEQKFKQTVKTFAYPGGYFTEEMLTKAEQVGYSHLFTVLPGKVKRTLPNNTLPRYVILGNDDRLFDYATSFRETQAGTVSSLVVELEYPVSPAPGAVVNSRLPVIEVDFSKAENMDPSTLKMRVAGFGEVPANFATEGKVFTWQVNRRLRHEVCQVEVTWKDLEGNTAAKPLRWGFQIDRGAAYLPDE